MIRGLGTDIIDIGRMERISMYDVDKSKVFTQDEHEYCKSKHHRLQHYAGFWAAKEAFRKASDNIFKPMNEIEIVHDETGCPKIKLHKMEIPPGYLVHVSISHDGGYATATVIIEVSA